MLLDVSESGIDASLACRPLCNLVQVVLLEESCIGTVNYCNSDKAICTPLLRLP